MGLISLITIYLTYNMSINKTSEDFAEVFYKNDLTAMKDIPSPLTSRPITLIIVFLSMIPFVVYSTWTIFVSTDNSSELVILPRKTSRLSMIIQRFVINVIVLFLNSILALCVFAILGSRAMVMNAEQVVAWRNSMFFGYFIASVIISAITILLSNFFKLITTLITVLCISIAIPLTTIALTAKGEGVTLKRLSEDSNTSLYGNYHADNFHWRPHMGGDGLVLSYDWKPERFNLGAMNPLKEGIYKEYSKWDSWMAISSIFNAFAKNGASARIKGSWTEQKTIGDVFDFNDSNSIEIGGVRYRKVYGIDLDHFETTYNWKEDNLFRPSRFQAPQFPNYFNSWLELLKTNDSVASAYKKLPFAYQEFVTRKILGSFDDKTKTLEQKFNIFSSAIDVEEAFDSFSFSPFIAHFDNENKERILPTKMYPDDVKWKEKQEYEIHKFIASKKYMSDSFINNQLFRGVLASNAPAYVKHYNEEYHVGLGIKIIWLITLLSIIPLSAFIYIRKDMK